MVELTDLFVHDALFQAHSRLYETVREKPEQEVAVLELWNSAIILAYLQRGLNGSRHGKGSEELTPVASVQSERKSGEEACDGCIDLIILGH